MGGGDCRSYCEGRMDRIGAGRVEVGEGGGFSGGGVEGWGAKAYNCNCITIKKKKKNTTWL